MIFVFDSLLLIAFSSAFDNNIDTILIIYNDYSIKAFSSSIIVLQIILSNILELIFYFLIIFSISRLISNLLMTVLTQSFFILVITDLPFRINNHYFSLFAKPFFSLIIDSFSTNEIIINIVFKLVLSVVLFVLSSLYFKKKEI